MSKLTRLIRTSRAAKRARAKSPPLRDRRPKERGKIPALPAIARGVPSRLKGQGVAAAVPLAEITKQSVALAVRLVGIMVEEASAVAIVRLVGITVEEASAVAIVRLVGITVEEASAAETVRLVGITVEEASAVAIVRLVGITVEEASAVATVRLVGITAATAEITAGLAPIGPKQGVRGVLDRTDPKAAGRVESSASVTRT